MSQGQTRLLILFGLLLLVVFLVFPVAPVNAFAAGPVVQGAPPTKGGSSDNPSALQDRFQKVIKDSLLRQRIPFRQFSWLAPKAINSDILALPFSIVVGTQKIVLPVYIIDHRYLVTTPLLDITQHYAVVPNIPPPQQVSLFIPSTTFPLGHFPSTGPVNAPHALIEFGDEQCSHCRKWNREVQADIVKDKTIRFTYIPYPLSTIHKNALAAAIFEMCVFQEKPDSFWTIHDQIDQRVDLKSIDKAALKPIFSGFMIQSKISTTNVDRCVEQSRPFPLISQTGDSLTALVGVPTTPTFILDGQVKSGYLSYDEIHQVFSKGTSAPAKPAK